MRADLYDEHGVLVAAVEVSDTDPPSHIDHRGRRYDWKGSGALLHDDAVEQVAWDYLVRPFDNDGTPEP